MIALACVLFSIMCVSDPVISPLPDTPFVAPTSTPTPTATPTPQINWEGVASYYSRSGCVGCSENLQMANGEQLDDSRLTVAFNRLPLGQKVIIENPRTGKKVIAEVTDTGGFERHNRIVDMTLATKEAIGCSDLCHVKIKKK